MRVFLGGRRQILALGLLVSMALSLTWYFMPRIISDYTVGGGGYWVCVDYIGEGTLYGGQPYCAQGPVIYYIGYAVSNLLGSGHLLYFLSLMTVAANVVIYVLVRDMLSRRGVSHDFLYTLLYLLMVYRFMSFVTSTLATCFYICGVYLLYHGRRRFRGLPSGFLFSLAVFTKMTTLLPVLIAIALFMALEGFEFVRRPGLESKLVFRGGPGAFLEPGISLSTVVFSYLMLSGVYPNMFDYVVSGHQMLVSSDLMWGLGKLISLRMIDVVAGVTVVLLLSYCLLKGFFGRDTIVYVMTQFSLVAYGLLFILHYGGLRIGSHYMLPAYPFLVASYMVVWKRSRRIFSLLFLVTLVYPSIYSVELPGSPIAVSSSPFVTLTRWDTYMGCKELREDVEYAFRFVPPQDGLVLTETADPELLPFERYDVSVDPGQVVIIPSGSRGFPSYEDPLWTPNLRERLNLTVDYARAYEEPLTPEEKVIKNDILSGKYSMIVVGPPTWTSVARITFQIPEYLSENFCVVFAPDFYYIGEGRHHTSLLFRDSRDCALMLSNMTEYYNIRHDYFCSKGKNPYLSVADVMRMNNLPFQMRSCDMPEEFECLPHVMNRIRLLDVLLTVALYFPVSRALAWLDD
ncbi:MAG: hypothetical protein GF416_03910 [Candidatus Altiarchaeales archaeon]|nr:hypothetical protein [Candidatus Altiarchaeales archaeon]MBD3416265.1 hypothetical protein [Candidatus Altiarchaeales archaeon]